MCLQASVPDILGIMMFNLILVNESLGMHTVGQFGTDLFLVTLLSLISCFLFLFIMGRMTHHVKFFLIISVLMLVYGIVDFISRQVASFMSDIPAVERNLNQLWREIKRWGYETFGINYRQQDKMLEDAKSGTIDTFIVRPDANNLMPLFRLINAGKPVNLDLEGFRRRIAPRDRVEGNQAGPRRAPGPGHLVTHD